MPTKKYFIKKIIIYLKKRASMIGGFTNWQDVLHATSHKWGVAFDLFN